MSAINGDYKEVPNYRYMWARLLGYTAGEMMLTDEAVNHLFEQLHSSIYTVFPIMLAVIVVIIGKYTGSNEWTA